MATLEERLRRLTSSKQQEPQQPPQQPQQQANTQAKPKPVRAAQEKQTTTTKDSPADDSKKKVEIPKVDAVLQGIKQEADTMEHSMVAKICNDLTRFIFSILTYPLELLDSWIVCKNILPDFTKRATTVWAVFTAVTVITGVVLLITAQDITIILAALLFALAGYLMLGVK